MFFKNYRHTIARHKNSSSLANKVSDLKLEIQIILYNYHNLVMIENYIAQ